VGWNICDKKDKQENDSEMAWRVAPRPMKKRIGKREVDVFSGARETRSYKYESSYHRLNGESARVIPDSMKRIEKH